MADDVKIGIGGDPSGYQEAVEKVKESTASLEEQLDKVGKIAAVAFAALTAEIYSSVKAFADGEEASRKLNLSLQNSGIFSEELAASYKKQAEALQELTGVDDDAITRGQALLQSMIGQKQITDEMAQAAVDLGTQLGSAEEGFKVLGQAINGNVRGLKQFGITVDESLTPMERQAEVLRLITQRFGGSAEAANKGLGSIQGLKSAFDDLQQAIGAKFAPTVERVIKFLTELFRTASNSKVFLDVAEHILVIGTVVTGAVTGIYALTKAMSVAKIAIEAVGLATKGLVGATGIGLLLVIASEIFINWNSIWPRMQAVYAAFVKNITDLTSGLGTLFAGVFTFSPEKIKEGLNEIKKALQNGVAEATKELPPVEIKVKQTQDPEKEKLAAEQAAITKRNEALQTQIILEERALRKEKLTKASQEEIKLEEEKINVLKAMQEETNADVIALYQQRLDTISTLQTEQFNSDAETRRAFNDEILAQNAEYQALDADQKEIFREENEAQLKAQLESENEIRRNAAGEKAQLEIKERNRFLADQAKFGTAYATLNKFMHSEVFQESKKAFGELAQLQQSSSNELKAIGKAAALANIAIKTYESAMNIFNGFSTIPIIGIALGIAGAAAAIAFGAEQTAKVAGVAQGGLITGGIPGVDSVPALLTPGELVTPEKNFEEVVTAVADARLRESGDVGGGGAGTIVIQLKDGLMDFIEAQLVERSNLNISIQG